MGCHCAHCNRRSLGSRSHRLVVDAFILPTCNQHSVCEQVEVSCYLQRGQEHPTCSWAIDDSRSSQQAGPPDPCVRARWLATCRAEPKQLKAGGASPPESLHDLVLQSRYAAAGPRGQHPSASVPGARAARGRLNTSARPSWGGWPRARGPVPPGTAAQHRP